MKVNIIGAGLAGSALAYVLMKRGVEVAIYEASSSIAHGASGNEVGLYNPRFSAQKDVSGAFYSDAFFLALAVFAGMGESIDFNPCGVLHLITDERKERRYTKCVESWGWGADDLRIIDADEASRIAGIEIEHAAMYVRQGGYVSPQKLCSEYARGAEVHLEHEVSDLNELSGDAVILGCGMGVLSFEEARYLPLVPVRGQVSYVEQNAESSHLKTAICYGGYIAPSKDGVHCVGATFDRKRNNFECYADDDLANLSDLVGGVGSLNGLGNIAKSRAGVRVSVQGRFPIVDQIGVGVYVSTAHGSHGILSTLLSAEILADKILGVESNVSKGLERALSVAQFMC